MNRQLFRQILTVYTKLLNTTSLFYSLIHRLFAFLPNSLYHPLKNKKIPSFVLVYLISILLIIIHYIDRFYRYIFLQILHSFSKNINI